MNQLCECANLKWDESMYHLEHHPNCAITDAMKFPEPSNDDEIKLDYYWNDKIETWVEARPINLEWLPEHYSLPHHPDCTASKFEIKKEQACGTDVNLPDLKIRSVPVDILDEQFILCQEQRPVKVKKNQLVESTSIYPVLKTTH